MRLSFGEPLIPVSVKIPSTEPRTQGVRVVASTHGSPAWKAGVRSGDRILAIDGTTTRDNIDIMYYSAEEEFEVLLNRDGREHTITIERNAGEHHGFTVENPTIRECANKCPFCFVDQNPAGKNLRPGLEIRDDDYRYSFLYGHYVTLTNLSRRDLERITAMRLSPLYVSVHATNPKVREQLLGRAKVDPLPVLRSLTSNGITCHTQVVLLPGINDGEELERTVRELHELAPGVASVAVVPVGLTSYHHLGVKGWTRETASEAVREIDEIGSQYPAGFVQAADEWFSILDRDPPPMTYYGGMEVIENGVGLIRTMIDDWKRTRHRLDSTAQSRSGGSYLFITGQSPRRWIAGIARELAERSGADIELRAATNHTFGPQVTVTGLLAWRDIVREIGVSAKETIVIPDVMLDGFHRFIDNVSVEEAEGYIRRRIRVVPSTAEGFFSALAP